MSKKKKSAKLAPASSERSGSEPRAYSKPPLRPYPKRHRVTVVFPQDGMTRQSFKDECAIDKIVGKFVDTGILTHLQRGSREYGDAPDQTLFEAAVTQAEIRSAGEDGSLAEYLDAQETPSDAPDARNEPETGSDPDSGENALHAENEAAELTSRAE